MEIDFLSAYGIDYKKGLINCMGSPTFYKKILTMFLDDDCFVRSEAAFRNKAYKELYFSTHELKGVTGNAALIRLYDKIVPLVDALRTDTVDEDEIKKLFEGYKKEYSRTIEGIKLFLEKK